MNHPNWLEKYLIRPEITDIVLHGAGEAFYDAGNGMLPFETHWKTEEFRTWVLELIARNGKTWDARHPFVDGRLEPNHRIHIAFPPISQKGILVSIRRLGYACSVDIAKRWEKSPAFQFIAQKVKAHETVLISGATGSGKTTLLADLISSIGSSERIIALEETPELHPVHPHWLSLQSRPQNPDGFGEITLRDLLRQSLRMRPDRILLGECRGPEVLDLLQCLNTGHRGTLATLHANSPRDALRRLELLCLLATGGKLESRVIRDLIVGGVQWMVHVDKINGQRMVTKIQQLAGIEGDIILLRDHALALK